MQTNAVPKLDKAAKERIREMCWDTGRALVILSPTDHYRVYSQDGIEAMSANAKKNKPWLQR
jgi:hypothetical protein